MLIRWLKAPNSKVVISFEESFNLKTTVEQSDNDKKGNDVLVSNDVKNNGEAGSMFKNKPLKARESDKCVHWYQLQPEHDDDVNIIIKFKEKCVSIN